MFGSKLALAALALTGAAVLPVDRVDDLYSRIDKEGDQTPPAVSRNSVRSAPATPCAPWSAPTAS